MPPKQAQPKKTECTGFFFCKHVILYFYPIMMGVGLAMTILATQRLSTKSSLSGYADSWTEVGIVLKEGGTVYTCPGGASRTCVVDVTTNETKDCYPQWQRCNGTALDSAVCPAVAKKLRSSRDALISAAVAYVLVLVVGILVWMLACLCDMPLWPWTVFGTVMLTFGIIASGLAIRFSRESLTAICATWPAGSTFGNLNTTSTTLGGFRLTNDSVEKTAVAGVAMGGALLGFHCVFFIVRYLLRDQTTLKRGAGTKFEPGCEPSIHARPPESAEPVAA